MDTNNTEGLKQFAAKHVMLSGGLLLLVLATVGLSAAGIGGMTLIVIAVGIASVQAVIIATTLMHLSSERRILVGLALLTVFLLIALLGLTFLGLKDPIQGTTHETETGISVPMSTEH